MNFKTTILFVMIGLFTSVSSCKDKEDGVDGPNSSTGQLTDSDKANLYDVIWYPNGGGLELQFLSDGVFRQALSLDGTWEWQNNGDTMNIKDYANKRYNFLFEEISSSTMKYRSNIGGDNYNTLFVNSRTK
ncbi:MAG: hypothetical protein JXR19_01985 [Bacteroidia bacterium]